MARQVLPWVGGLVGMWTGVGFNVGFAAGSLLGNAIDPQTIRGPSIGEGQNNVASEGGYRPIVLGKGAVGVCMIHQGPTIKRTISQRQSKGGGPVTEQERIYRTMAFALGEAADPDQGVLLLRLWIDNKLRYDVTPTSEITAESAEFANEFTFYPGNDTQEPDPDLEAMPAEWGGGAGNVPSYRGGAPYIVLPEWDVTDSGGRAPMIKAELASQGAVILGNTLAIGYVTSPSSDNACANSSDGENWSPAITSSEAPVSTYISPLGNSFVVWDAFSAYVTDNLGVEFDGPFGSFGGVGGQHQAYTRSDVLLIPSGSGTLFRTTNGRDFTSITLTGFGSNCCAVNETMAVSIRNGYGDCQYSTDPSHSVWSDGGFHGVYAIGDRWIECSPTHFMIGGTSSNISPKPRIAATSHPSSWPIQYTFSESGGERIKLLCAGNEDDWIAVTDNDEVWWTDDNGQSWEEVDREFGNVTGLCFNGRRFILSEGIYSPGAILTSDDKTNWQEQAQPLHNIHLVSCTTALHQADGAPLQLSAFVDYCHDRANAARGDTLQLTDEVEGVVLSGDYMSSDAIRTAMGWYQFDAGEYDAGSGYKINYVKRGGAAIVTLTDADIIDGPEDWEREDSYERPRVLHVAYQNPVADYGAPVIPIKRTSHDVLVVGERSVSIPFVTSDQDEVARRGDVALTVIYTEIAGTVEVILPISWLSLAPTNCIGYSIRGRVRRLRMTNWRFRPDGTISTEWIADRQSAQTSNLTALPPVPPTPPPPSIVGPAVSAVLDIPALADSLDTLHLIVAASGQTPAWWGAAHQRKLPSDPDYTTALQFTAPTTIMGTLDDDVADASEHFTDTTNVVRVTLYSDDELQTFTQAQFLSENGAFALAWDDGGTRRWEVLQYRDAVKVGEQTWELTTLARGRLDTETAAHPPGSLFVLLDAGIRAMAMQSAWLDEEVTHRAVSNGQLPDQASPYTETYTGESQRAWPVANLFASLNGDTLEAAWVPRHRFGTDDHPVRSVNWTGYRVTATDGANTLSADTTADSHSFDVTGWSTPITVSVSQLNRFTGEGPAVTEEVA